MSAEFKQLLAKSQQTVQHLTKIKEYAITALSNLIASNIDIGLKYSLSLAFHDDLKTRAAFLQVLANILQEDVKSVDLKAEPRHVFINKLLGLVCDDSLILFHALCENVGQTDVDELASLVFPVFQSAGKSLQMLSAVLNDEVQKTDTEANLFRRNSIATRTLILYAKLEGQEFLQLALKPVLDELVSSGGSYEIDPLKLGPDEKLEQNTANLKRVTNAFIDAILNHGSKFPKSLCIICAKLFQFSSTKFPGSELNAVGGFVFLRLICPSIVAPEAHGLAESGSLSKEVRRCLMLVTKIIQNLANNVLFGNKEVFMIGMNDLVKENEDRIHTFLRKLADPSLVTATEEPRELFTTSEADILRLHRYIETNLVKLERIMTATDPRVRADTLRVVRGGSVLRTDSDEFVHFSKENVHSAPVENQYTQRKKVFDELSLILFQLGPAATHDEIAKAVKRQGLYPAPVVASPDDVTKNRVNRHFVEFMARYELVSSKSRDLDKLRELDLFYDAGTDKQGHPVYVLVANRLDPEHIDPLMFLYYVFTKLSPIFSSPFDIVVDLTFFGPANEWTIEALMEMEKICPLEVKKNLKLLSFLHPNAPFKSQSKKTSRVLHPRLFKQIQFASTLSDLEIFMNLDQVILPKLALAVSEADATKFQVSFLTPSRASIPVLISISSVTIQIVQEKSQDLLGSQVFLVDTFHMTDILDLGPVNVKGSIEGEFFIKLHEGEHEVKGDRVGHGTIKQFGFASYKRDMILQTIRSALARFELSKPAIDAAQEVYLSPRDHPETLLNIAFFNMGADDALLRVVSYNLLASVLTTFKYLTDELYLQNAKGLAIPMNNFRFVREISERLANTQKHLTLKFVHECVTGFNNYDRFLKHHVIQYLSPWIQNLSIYLNPSASNERLKLTDIFTALLNLTLKDKSVDYFQVAESDDLVPFVLELMVLRVAELSLSSPEVELMGNTLMTMASINLPVVAGRLLHRIRHVFETATNTKSNSLVDQPCWKELTILLRFVLLLSFDNQLNVNHYLPDLCHILCIFVGLGPPIIRRTVYAILVNIIQTFCIIADSHELRVSGLQLVLAKLSDSKYCKLFGISAVANGGDVKAKDLGSQAFVLNNEALSLDVIKEVPLSDIESFINILLDVSSYAASSSEVLAAWRTRWVSLAAKGAFEEIGFIQCRAYLSLGCLSKDGFDPDLLFQCFIALNACLKRLDEVNIQLVLSIITCICHVLTDIPSSEAYICAIFWLSVTLLQTGSEAIYLRSMNLMLIALDLIERDSQLRGVAISKLLINGRTASTKAMESLIQIQFGDYFGFSVSAALLRGLNTPLFHKTTLRVLSKFLELFCHDQNWSIDIENARCIWGFLIPLLPVVERIDDVLVLAKVDYDLVEVGSADVSSVNSNVDYLLDTLFQLFAYDDDILAILSMISLQILLNATDSEAESMVIYKLYAKFASRMPQTFALIYPSLATKFSSVILSSKTSQMSESVHDIFRLLTAAGVTSNPLSYQDILSKAGMKGILESGSFSDVTKESKSKRIQVVCDMLDSILAIMF